MILYFSGTGNSEYVAGRIGEMVGDEAQNIFYKLKSKDKTPISSEKPWVIVTPTYAWQIPHIIRDMLLETELIGSRKIYFVMTCGGENGNAGEHNRKLAETCGLEYMGTASVVMPENYLAMFRTPSDGEAAEIIAKAKPRISRIADRIRSEDEVGKGQISFVDKLKSGIVNKIFYERVISAAKFRFTDKCTSCGLCERICPMSNIMLVVGHPVWGKSCTHCMACIARCPVSAIEYGKKTETRNRYYCGKNKRG